MHRMAYGYRVFVCSNMAFAGEFTPVFAKHSRSFSLIDSLAIGVDRMQRSFGSMQKKGRKGSMREKGVDARHPPRWRASGWATNRELLHTWAQARFPVPIW